MATRAETIIGKLIAMGWQEGKATAHYRTFENARYKHRLFVGRNGALRSGQNVSSTYAVAGGNYEQILAVLDLMASKALQPN